MKYNGTMKQNLKYRNTILQIYTYFPGYISVQTSWHNGCMFLNYSQAPLVLTLQKSMKIEIYNDMYFQQIKFSVKLFIKD